MEATSQNHHLTRPAAYMATLIVALVLTLVLAACGGTGTTGVSATEDNAQVTDSAPAAEPTSEPTAAPTNEPTAAPTNEPASTASAAPSLLGGPAIIEGIDPTYANADGVWPGFVPNEHPVVLAVRDDNDDVVGAITLNHPAPDAIGDATELDTSGLTINSAHEITNLDDAQRQILQRVEPFDFARDIGGVDSFAMMAGGTDQFFDPTEPEYAATLVHEMFHRYQIVAFTPGGFQDVEGYAYTAENMTLALLEDRALLAALNADTPETQSEAARHAAAIRLVRLDADSRVSLDGDQEVVEGTARYIEHRTAVANGGTYHTADNYDAGLVTDLASIGPAKEHFGFGRFYATGAAQMKLLDDLGIENVTERIEANQSPLAILAEEFGLTVEDAQAIVEEAKAAHDPAGELPGAGDEAAEAAAQEPPVFGSEALGDDFGEAEEIGSALTAAEVECLEAGGVDFTSNPTIPSDLATECFQ